MKISVIVSVYNKEKYIHRCVDSITGQTYDDLEIILVDDGSTDKSAIICDEYAHRDARIKVIHKENGGLVSAWKKGTSVATGEYLAYVDSDDWIDTDMFEKLVAHTTGRDDEIVLSDYVIEKMDGSKTYVYQDVAPGEYVGSDIHEKIFPRLWGLEDRAVCRSRCMKLFSASLVKDNARYGNEKLRFGEDTSLTIPCVLSAGRLFFCDHEAMYHYLFVSDSMVHEYDSGMMESIRLGQEICECAIRDKYEAMNCDISMDRLLELAAKEYVFMLMYAVKNAVKAPRNQYISLIRNICMDEKNRNCINNLDIEVRHPANKMIYRVMKHPTVFNCIMLRTAMGAWKLKH